MINYQYKGGESVKRTWIKKSLLVILLVGILFVLAGTVYLKMNTYAPSEAALAVAKTGKSEDQILFFEGEQGKPAIIFYQGALVEKESYSLWAQEVAKAGYPVYLVATPLNLPVLQQNAAEAIIAEHQLTAVVMGGHSLGGVMSSRFVSSHLDHAIKGVFFLASYPDEKGSLENFSGSVLSITGDRDGVLNQEAYQEAQRFLPDQTVYEVIAGGNHAGFGSYGEQKGDQSATITNEEQQTQISQLLIRWLENLE